MRQSHNYWRDLIAAAIFAVLAIGAVFFAVWYFQ